MAQIPVTYTGTNSGAAPVYRGSLTEQSIGRGLDQTTRAKQQDVAYAKQEEKDFLEALRVDPIAVASKRVTKQQAQAAEQFQSKWTDIYAQHKGRLPLEMKAEMRTDIDGMRAWQQEKLADHNQYLNAAKQFNPQIHDPEEFYEKSRQYIEEDKVPVDGFLSPAAMDYQSYTDALYNIADQREWQEQIVGESGGSYTTAKISPWEEDKAKYAYENFVLSNPSASKGLSRRFTKSLKKEQYLDSADANNDGTVSPRERENAIIEFGWAEEAQDIFLQQRGGKERKSSSRSGGGLTAEEKNAQLRERLLTTENLKEKGLSSKYSDNGYYYSPTNGGYALQYKKELGTKDEKGFNVPSDAIAKTALPENVEVADGQIFIEPNFISKDGSKMRMFVPVVKTKVADTVKKKAGLVGKTNRWKTLNRMFENQGTNEIVDMDENGDTRRYRQDENGTIYRLEEEKSTEEVTVPTEGLKSYVYPYFFKLNEVVGGTNEQIKL